MESEAVFKAMADKTRQRTLSVLRLHELSVSELVATLNQPQSTISRHLKVLHDAELIHDRRDGTTTLYSVANPALNGDSCDLNGLLLDWVATQPLEPLVSSRLDRVIHDRRDMSSRFFDRVGRQWDTLREESFGPCFHLEAFLTLLPGDWTVADIGTGTGYLLPALARHFQRVVAVEPADKMLAAARRRIEFGEAVNVDLRRGDLSQLPIEESAVDLALAVLVVHHVPAPRDALRELHRIVRGGGRVLIVEQTSHQNEAFHERMQDRWWGFDPSEFMSLLESVGFQDVVSRSLATVNQPDDAPNLFVVTAKKTDDSPSEK